ncbi:MAG: secretin and TonB N-terminal domain-containing protein [Candidatus Omnitrophica bacterium]|nr:secretin and TonB N-terminal domain-containing protein [Candidatus Omnitrophota bacterium]
MNPAPRPAPRVDTRGLLGCPFRIVPPLLPALTGGAFPWGGVNLRLIMLGLAIGLVSRTSGVSTAWAQDNPEGSVTEPPAASAEPVIASSSESLISVDFKDADIRQVLRVIALKSGTDIVAGPDVEGLITIKLTDVPWEQSLDIILRTYGLTYERKGRVIRVLTLKSVEQEALATDVFPLNYAKAQDVTKVLNNMRSDRGRVEIDERTNTVIVTDLPANLFQLKKVIDRLDSPTPQVHIESRFIETRLSRDENLGIDWFDSVQVTATPATAPTTFPFRGGADLGTPGDFFLPRPGTFSPSTGASLTHGRIPETGGTFTFGTITMAQLSTTINMLKQRVDTKVISNPTIVTLNNIQASVQVGTDVNIPNFQVDASTGRATVTGFQTRSTGIILNVTPHINPQEEVVLEVKPEITTIGSDRTFASGIVFPDFDVQKAVTQVRLRDGQTLAIGGLKRQAEQVTKSSVPWIGDLPLVGWLFTNRRERTPQGQDTLDLLIFLTVRLVKESSLQQTASTPSSTR